MSLFRKAGEKFEETKRSVMGGGGAEYRCESCTESVSEPSEHCPHCGEDAVVAVE
ncbi:hypothetical protein [Halorubrum sp. DTA98]|uniref:hypothetical protein n=1 Tax=Halorubrum sp. DTA98 TaxID=3402163 RepID=UPI003AAF6072